jgi:flagellar hook-associated protein 2
MIADRIHNSGDFTSLAQLGFETERDGSLTLNNSVLSDAIDNDFESFEKLFAGEGEIQGIAEQFTNYLESLTDFTDGFLAGRKENIDSNIDRIDRRIEMMEMRLEKREANLYSQFQALELLISEMNATSDYLTKQLASLESMWDFNKD